MPEQKAVLVTGAAMGIGAGIAERFAEAGYAIAVFDINGQGAREMASRFSRAIAIEGDVSHEDDAIRAVATTVNELGRLDVLINNAGIELAGTLEEQSSADWDRQIAVNLRGVFLMSKYAVPRMRPRGGAIVNISSVHALVSWPGSAAYDATKAGIIGMTRAMALDHGGDRIRVNAICPGYIQTPLMDRWLETVPDPGQTMRDVLKYHPLGRIGTPHDVAEAALFLASAAASFISGTYLVVDGGMTVSGH